MSCDAWGNLVRVSDGFVHYRNRSIDVHSVDVIQAKGKRLFINHYRENNNLPKMCIICSNSNDAIRLYEYLIEAVKVEKPQTVYYKLPSELSQLFRKMNTYFFNFMPSNKSFLGCSRD
jgi:hypothetical protein